MNDESCLSAIDVGTALVRLSAERDPLYTDVADVVLDVDGLTPDEVVDGIMRAVS